MTMTKYYEYMDWGGSGPRIFPSWIKLLTEGLAGRITPHDIWRGVVKIQDLRDLNQYMSAVITSTR